MPLTSKGEKIKSAMQEQYGKEKGEEVFYASENKGTISGVHQKDAEDHPRNASGQFTTRGGPSKGPSNPAGMPTPSMPSNASGPGRGMSGPSGKLPPWMKSSAKTGDAEEADLAMPKRRPDLLGTVMTPEGMPPADRKFKAPEKQTEASTGDQGSMPMLPTTGGGSMGMGSSSTPTATATPNMIDSKDEKADTKGALPPMNNLSRPGNPGANNGTLVPYQGVQVGDSLHNQNIRNRAFWARNKR